ncbi:hypothetical protein [Pseudomonas sp. H9]|uniref:hypothetical protein n=1 Tax=Pseudomonas sp. H9 TaxID=483968 RepID=UPI0010579F83|nr:hypothetical protein [Pseudomonas sp. H9]TDF81198.1 hypothetical protein E1573_18435 [Pseudomonas sp. H9]
MKTVLIITDSLGLPRVKPERIADDECWVYRLQDLFNQRLKFRTICTPGMDTRQLLVASRDYHQAINPDLVILQVGIVDCYPRALKRGEVSLIKRLPKTLNMMLHKLVKRHYGYLIKRRKIQYVGATEFRNNLLEVRKIFPGSQFRIVPIAPPCSDYRAKNPLIEIAVNNYNKIFMDLFGSEVLADCYADSGDRIFMSDNHHLNTTGHDQVFNVLSQVLYEFSGSKA